MKLSYYWRFRDFSTILRLMNWDVLITTIINHLLTAKYSLIPEANKHRVQVWFYRKFWDTTIKHWVTNQPIICLRRKDFQFKPINLLISLFACLTKTLNARHLIGRLLIQSTSSAIEFSPHLSTLNGSLVSNWPLHVQYLLTLPHYAMIPQIE